MKLWYGRSDMARSDMAAWICYKCDAESSHKFCKVKENSLTDVHKRLQQVAKQLLGTSQFPFV